MTGGNFKAGPWIIVRANWRTYVDVRDEKPRWQDWLAFGLPPLAVVGLVLWRDIELPSAASAALLTVFGLLSAFLFGVTTQISGRAMDFADSRPTPSRATTAHAVYLEELAANAGYAALLCVAAAAAFVVATVGHHLVLLISSSIGLALTAHLAMVLLMVMRRQFALTKQQLDRARTGADSPDQPARRASVVRADR